MISRESCGAWLSVVFLAAISHDWIRKEAPGSM